MMSMLTTGQAGMPGIESAKMSRTIKGTDLAFTLSLETITSKPLLQSSLLLLTASLSRTL